MELSLHAGGLTPDQSFKHTNDFYEPDANGSFTTGIDFGRLSVNHPDYNVNFEGEVITGEGAYVSISRKWGTYDHMYTNATIKYKIGNGPCIIDGIMSGTTYVLWTNGTNYTAGQPFTISVTDNTLPKSGTMTYTIQAPAPGCTKNCSVLPDPL